MVTYTEATKEDIRKRLGLNLSRGDNSTLYQIIDDGKTISFYYNRFCVFDIPAEELERRVR